MQVTLKTELKYKGKVIAHTGDVVSIVADHGNIVVIQTEKGERHSVHIEKLNWDIK